MSLYLETIPLLKDLSTSKKVGRYTKLEDLYLSKSAKNGLKWNIPNKV